MNRRLTVISSAVLGFALAAGLYAPTLASTSTSPTAAPAAATTSPSTTPLAQYRVISYTPSDSKSGSTGLSYDLWGSFNAPQIQSDLALIRGLGADAVRIFISTGDTGSSYPFISPTFNANLASFVRLAQQTGLKVVLSIFNEFPYVPTDSAGWTDTTKASFWMASLLSPFKSNPEVAYIEMRNEIPVPGYDSPNPVGSGLLAMGWLNTMMPRLRSDAGTDPIVLSQNHGVAGYEQLDQSLSSSAKPDAYGYHFYDYPGFLYGQLTTLRARLSRPLFVGETGYSTVLSNTVGGGGTLSSDSIVRDNYQGWYLQAVAAVTSSLGMGVPAIWQLWDTPNNASPYETDFGLYDNSTGSPVAKPAAAVVSGIFARAATGLPIPTPSINGTFNNPGSASPPEVPSPWNMYYITGQTSTSSAQGGSSLCVNQAGNDSYFFEDVPLTTDAGTHTLSVWAQGGGFLTSVAIRWLDMTGSPIGPDVRVAQAGTTTQWSQLQVTSAPPAGASAAELILQSNKAVCFSNIAFS